MKSLAFAVLCLVSTASAAEKAPHAASIGDIEIVNGDMARVQTCDQSVERTPRSMHEQIIFLAMDGGTYVQGSDSPSNNRSFLVASGTAEVSAFQPLEPEKQARMLRCTQLMFGRFNVIVTDVEPAPGTPYIEAVVTGGSSNEIGLANSILGIAPAPCDPADEGVVWIFGAYYDNDIQATCETAAQEIAHIFGLDHEVICEDPMTYESGCHPKSFQDRDSRCGEYMSDPPRNCSCTGDSQNSVQELIGRLGPGEVIPPEVSITTPAEGAELTGAFTVVADARDNYVVATTEVWVDGVMIASDDLPPYEMIVPKTIVPGAHTVEVRAFDANNNTATTMINLTTLPECATDDECTLEGQRCNGHYCAGDFGAECQGNEDCAEGLSCGARAGENKCTVSCSQSASVCPDGFECPSPASPTEGRVCWPGSSGGCGCRVTERDRGTGAGVLSLFGLALVGTLRSRRGRSRR
jgi:hypothetical protein